MLSKLQKRNRLKVEFKYLKVLMKSLRVKVQRENIFEKALIETGHAKTAKVNVL